MKSVMAVMLVAVMTATAQMRPPSFGGVHPGSGGSTPVRRAVSFTGTVTIVLVNGTVVDSSRYSLMYGVGIVLVTFNFTLAASDRVTVQ